MPNGTEEAKKYKDITLYPVRMRDYERYLPAKAAWKQRQAFLPVKYLFQPFLQALFLYAIDQETEAPKDAPKAAFFGLLEMLILVCKLNTTASDFWKYGVMLRKQGDALVLDHLSFVQDGKEKTITVADFSPIRAIVAEMNGIELPVETDNIDILRSYADKIAHDNRNAKEVKYDLADLIDTVAYLSHDTYSNVLEWTVKYFERRRRTIDRIEKYHLYAQAEFSGTVTFKKGNPCPSIYFDVIEDTYGTLSLQEANLSGAASQIDADNDPQTKSVKEKNLI